MTQSKDTYRHKGLRQALVEKLKAKGIINSSVLQAIGIVPRHLFIDSAFVDHAYQDKAFAIGEGQTISQPFTVAFQSSLLELKKHDKVLEIGTGSGYQASILLEMKCQLTTIEHNLKLYLKAKKTIQSFGYNCTNIHGDGTLGYEKNAPYDKIIVTAGAPSIPKKLIQQLKIGGTLIIPVGNNDAQKMYRLTKIDTTKIKKEEYNSFSFVPLVGKDGW